MSWKESVYKATLEEVWGIEHHVKEMYKEKIKDMKIIKPTGLLQFKEGNMESKVLTRSFQEAMVKIRDNNTPSPQDFFTMANVGSMLHLNKELMPKQSKKIRKLKW